MCIYCFPGTAKVWTTGGYISISELKSCSSTDYQLLALTKNATKKNVCLKKTPFYSFLHFEPNRTAQFITLECDNKAQLILSEEHLVFRMNLENEKSQGIASAISAKNIKIGDRLIYVNESNGEITNPTVVKIGHSEIEGVYAPLTKNGTLIVDGFMVSCYAHVDSHEMAHSTLAPLRLWFKSGNKINHLIKPKYQNLNHQEEGIHPYAKALMSIRTSLIGGENATATVPVNKT